jgi:hypothetical protein
VGVFDAFASPLTERYVVTNATVFRLYQPEIFSDPLTEMLRNGARVPRPRRCADNIPASRTLSASGARHLPGREVMTGANPAPVLLPFRRHRRDSEHWLGAHEIVRRRGQSCG